MNQQKFNYRDFLSSKSQVNLNALLHIFFTRNIEKMIFYFLIASSPKQPPESHESTDLLCLQVGLQLYEMWVRLLPNLINLLLSV